MLFSPRLRRRLRLSNLRAVKLGHAPCPKRRLTLQALLLVALILLFPTFAPAADWNTAPVSASASGDTLAIDSETFSLDMLPTSEDGFLLKNSSQTVKADRSSLSDIFNYTVEEGDTLSSIAHQFGVSMETVIWENSITNPHALKPGTVLAILPTTGVSHVVAEGDTLENVAKKYDVDAAALAKQNQLASGAKLVASEKLIIPGGRKTIEPAQRTILAAAKKQTLGRSVGQYVGGRGRAVDGAIISANAAGKGGKWMIKPTQGNITTYFRQHGHTGVDLADRSRPLVRAAAKGTVVKAQCGWNGGYGCMVVLDHGDGMQSLYGHLSRIDVAVGRVLGQGETLGKMGNTGNVHGATGIHLHFEVIDHGRKKNPLAYYN